jgi:hypothetical protein
MHGQGGGKRYLTPRVSEKCFTHRTEKKTERRGPALNMGFGKAKTSAS